MSIKHYTKGSGYTKKHRYRATNPTRQEFEETILPSLGGLTFDARIKKWEEVCQHTLTAAGYAADVNAENFDQALLKIEFQSNEWFACQILRTISFIQAIRDRADKREESGLLNFTLDLGRLTSEWEVKAGMSLTAKSASWETQSKQEKRREAYEHAIGRKLNHPTAVRAAAEECGVDPKTIRRALKAK